MKYVAWVIAGLFFGAYSEESWGVLVGGLLGWLVARTQALSSQVKHLQRQQRHRESRELANPNLSQPSATAGPISAKSRPEPPAGVATGAGQVKTPTQELDLSQAVPTVDQEALNPDGMTPLNKPLSLFHISEHHRPY